jgi:hypothetical protein
MLGSTTTAHVAVALGPRGPRPPSRAGAGDDDDNGDGVGDDMTMVRALI